MRKGGIVGVLHQSVLLVEGERKRTKVKLYLQLVDLALLIILELLLCEFLLLLGALECLLEILDGRLSLFHLGCNLHSREIRTVNSG